MSNRALIAVGVIGSASLALSIHTSWRLAHLPAPSPAPSSTVCVDQQARTLAEGVRQALVQRAALEARGTTAADGSATGVGAAPVPSPASSQQIDPGPRRYARFEIDNPAVSVKQKPDGTYDIRTTDPALAGSVIPIKAVTATGETDQLLIRIPE